MAYDIATQKKKKDKILLPWWWFAYYRSIIPKCWVIDHITGVLEYNDAA